MAKVSARLISSRIFSIWERGMGGCSLLNRLQAGVVTAMSAASISGRKCVRQRGGVII